jgi:hypothetical protein
MIAVIKIFVKGEKKLNYNIKTAHYKTLGKHKNKTNRFKFLNTLDILLFENLFNLLVFRPILTEWASGN